MFEHCDQLRLDLLAPHHVYRNAAGIRIPSVTTISGMAKFDLSSWHNKQGLQGIDTGISVPRLADIGTITHGRIEATLTRRIFDESNLDPALTSQSLHGYRRFMYWWEEQGFKPHANELRLVSERMQVGGTLDIIARRRDGNLVLLDIKATNRIHREHKIQVAGGYAPIYLDATGERFADVLIVRVGREANDKIEVVRVTDRPAYERAFRALRKAYDTLERLPVEK